MIAETNPITSRGHLRSRMRDSGPSTVIAMLSASGSRSPVWFRLAPNVPPVWKNASATAPTTTGHRTPSDFTSLTVGDLGAHDIALTWHPCLLRREYAARPGAVPLCCGTCPTDRRS